MRLGFLQTALVLAALSVHQHVWSATNSATQISERAASSITRFAYDSAEWRTEIELPSIRTVYRVNVLKERERVRYAGYAVPPEGDPIPIFRLFVVSNVWHVVEADLRVKCRPWEHYFQYPVSELLLEAADLRFPTDSSLLSTMTVEGTNETSIQFRESLAPAESNHLAAVKAELDSVLQPQLRDSHKGGVLKMDFIRKILEHGRPLRVNYAEGFIDQWESARHKVTVSHFRWLPQVSTNRIRLGSTNYVDRTNPYRGADWSRCALVAHDPSGVGGKNPNVSPRVGILQLNSGMITRLPLPTIGGMGGCFLAGRTNVLSFYQDITDGTGLSLVDLPNGEVNSFEVPGDGQLIGPPVLAPDQNRVAMLFRPRTATSVLEFQVLLFDLKKRVATALGRPGRLGAPYSWLPDGSGIVLKRFLPAGSDDIEPRMICVMRLDGTVTDLCAGDMPLVIPSANGILHEGEDREWFICNFEGKETRRFAGGMKGYGSPTISPDGKEVLWVRFSSDELPKLRLFQFEGQNGKAVTKAPGFVSHPVW